MRNYKTRLKTLGQDKNKRLVTQEKHSARENKSRLEPKWLRFPYLSPCPCSLCHPCQCQVESHCHRLAVPDWRSHALHQLALHSGLSVFFALCCNWWSRHAMPSMLTVDWYSDRCAHASTINSVLDGITDEITGLLFVLTDVTLEWLDLSCQVCLVVFTKASLQQRLQHCSASDNHTKKHTPHFRTNTSRSSEQSSELGQWASSPTCSTTAQWVQLDCHVTVDHQIWAFPSRKVEDFFRPRIRPTRECLERK